MHWSVPVLAILAALASPVAARATAPITIVALGDSLTAGYELPPGDGFPAKLQAALRAKGEDVRVVDAGVSGDTTSDGLARLDWSVPKGTDGVIVELGGNDALRGISPAITEQNLDTILTRLKQRGIPVLLAGMLAPPNMGQDYVQRFDAIFPTLAKTHGVLFYPFFLEGVATHPEFGLGDGIHPNAKGVDVMVENILPKVEELVAKARASRS